MSADTWTRRLGLLDNALSSGHRLELLVVENDAVLTEAQGCVVFERLGRYQI
jgi:hypothetical protein